MTHFKELPRTKHSISRRKMLEGVGINDAEYMVYITINGKQLVCPYYRAWTNMIKRSYSEKSQLKRPTYKGCSVAKEWHLFSNFRGWMEKQAWKGKHLDKDILIAGNKVYGPLSCIFVSLKINNLLNGCSSNKLNKSQGICLDKTSGRYKASCSVGGKVMHIGRFSTKSAAEYAYLIAKSKVIDTESKSIESSLNPRLKGALTHHAKILKSKALQVQMTAAQDGLILEAKGQFNKLQREHNGD